MEYYFDDPNDDTDSADIPKVGYAREFKTQTELGGRVVPYNFIIGSGFYGTESGSRTEVEATVLGDAVEGLAVEFSRAVSGREPNYLWNGFTDAAGQVSLAISGARQVSGYYRARARNADGEVVGRWSSIPLNQDRRQVLELTLGGGARIVSVEALDAAETAESTGGLGPNVPNPFNPSTQIAYRLSSPGPVRLVIYNVLGQPVRTLVDRVQAAGSYQVRWDARDGRGVSLSSGGLYRPPELSRRGGDATSALSRVGPSGPAGSVSSRSRPEMPDRP